MKKRVLLLALMLITLLCALAAAETTLTAEEAKAIALEHAGVLPEAARFFEEKLDDEDGARVYDLEFIANDRVFDYEIDAQSGEIYSFDADPESYDAQSGAITPEAALSIALSYAGFESGEVKVDKVKRDTEGGRVEYEVEFRAGRTEYECTVDAASGAILEWDKDD